MTDGFRVITSVPMFVEAWLDHDDGTLEVRRSPVVRPSDDYMEPVRRYLDKHCMRLHELGTEEDLGFMFGEVECSSFEVFDRCPGVTTPHSCVYEKKGAKWLTTVQ